jgi:hypothetical protein
MAAKKVNLAQAKAARQKKIAIGGSALLVIVLVIQVPRMMKQLKGSNPAPAAAPVSPTPAPATPVAGVPTAVAATDKLVSFESFTSKDPFIQQVSEGAAASAPAASSTTTGGTASATASNTTTGTSQTTAFKTSAGAGSSTPKGAQTATIQVNGSAETVGESKTFPKSNPVFKLVSVGEGSVEVAIADGSFKDGDKTITLTEGKSVTLLNTASDKRYKLLLVSTSG